jgi:hypothetical protein
MRHARDQLPLEAISLVLKPTPAPGLAEAVVGEETLLAIEPSRPCLLLNPTASMIWESIDGHTDLATIATRIAHTTGADQAVVSADVLELTRQLGSLGVLSNVFCPGDTDRIEVPFEAGDLGDFDLPDLTGCLRSWAGFRGRQVLLINWSSYCGHCVGMAPLLGSALGPLRQSGIELVFVASGGAEHNWSVLEPAGLGEVVTLCRPDGTGPFAGLGTPAAMLYAEDGRPLTPLAYGAHAVADLVGHLASLDPEEGPGPGAAPVNAGGVCPPYRSAGSDGRRDGETSGTAVYRWGRARAAVAFNGPHTEAILDRLFPNLRIEDPSTPPMCAVFLHPTPDPGPARPLSLLTRSGLQLVRSRSPGRVLRALVGYLSAEIVPPNPALLHVDAIGVVQNGAAYLLPSILYQTWSVVQPRLNRLGFQTVDLPRVSLDPLTAELVVEDLHIPYRTDLMNEIETDSHRDSELAPVGPGRYPLRGWIISSEHDQGPLATARSVALSFELITYVPTLQSVLDDLVTLFKRATGYTLPTDSAQTRPDRLLAVLDRVVGHD